MLHAVDPGGRRGQRDAGDPGAQGRMLGSSWVVPSGNTATTWRSARARTAAANVARLSVASPVVDPALHGHGPREVQQDAGRRH